MGRARGDEHRWTARRTTPSTRLRSTDGSTSTWWPTTIPCSPRVRDRLGADAPPGLFTAVGYDLGLLVAEGLARAPELTAEGVRDGLELVKQVPSAEGRAGTTLGFGHWDRGALHGPYLVLRQWRDGVSIEVGRAGAQRLIE